MLLGLVLSHKLRHLWQQQSQMHQQHQQSILQIKHKSLSIGYHQRMMVDHHYLDTQYFGIQVEKEILLQMCLMLDLQHLRTRKEPYHSLRVYHLNLRYKLSITKVHLNHQLQSESWLLKYQTLQQCLH